MPNPAIILLSLLAIAFTLVTWIQPWHSSWEGDHRRDQGILAVFMGDGRRLFGEYFFRKADIYFHSGVYPSIFDQAAAGAEEYHMASAASAPTDAHDADEDDHDHEHAHDDEHEPDHEHEHEAEEGHADEHEHAELAPRTDAPVDWLDRFSRNFYPTRHVHLEESTDAREILPWIRLSTELDPQRIATYTTAAFWLRRHLGKVDEAEQFLRDGLRANPGSPEILFELGRLYDEDSKDPVRARNLFELALRQWLAETDPDQDDVDLTMFRQILAHLAWLEERQGNLPQAIQHWQTLQPRLEDSTVIQQRIEELQSRLASPPSDPAPP